MRLLPCILLFSLLGCGDRELPSGRATRQIQQWIPVGTPLASARQIMEQHQFTCSVISYTNKEGMVQGAVQDADAHYWDTSLWVDGKAVAVTNITHLQFKKTNCWGVLTYINSNYSGGLRVMAVGQ